MNNIEDQICQAIDIIVQRAISQAKYDKTIQATIVKCIDQAIGKYTVRYQDSTFYAYSSSPEVSYSKDTAVYVLVPSGNMSKDKTIIGAVKNLGANFIAASAEIDKYDIVGDNNIDNNNQVFGLKSYSSDKIVEILYSKDSSYDNKINVNEANFYQCLSEADNIICAATFKTNLPIEQQFNGNYGLIIALNFNDESTGEIVTREYVIDVNNMQGNPYRLVNDTRQAAVFSINSENYLEVDYIAIFCYDFPHSKPDAIEDIWVKNIELIAAKRATDEEINGYSISFVTPKGICFDENHGDEDTLTIKAQVKVKGRVIDPDSQTVDFYWFIENTHVTSQSKQYYKYYNQYGGQGWQCLNQYNLINSEAEDTLATIQWVPADDTYIITKKDIAAKETLLKCVAVYNGVSISKEISIKRLDSNWTIAIESSNGISFYFDNGKTDLACLVNGEKVLNDYTYCWAKISQNGYFETLSDTEESNATYADILKQYNDLEESIKNEEVLVSKVENELNQLKNKLKEFDNVTRVDKNVIYNLAGNSIDRISTFKCSVYQGETFLGTGTITLTNQNSAEGTWNLIIHNGEKIFKYNEYGVSPADPSNLKPVTIDPLTFSLYDNLGNEIDENAIKAENISWIIPINNTMLKMVLDEEESYIDNEDGTRTYTKIRSLPYKIADSYNVKNQRNNIRLEVVYKDMRLTATTSLIFIKQGDAGTNGSDYICRIVPNCSDDILETPMATKDKTTNQVKWNFNSNDKDILFKAQLWHNEDLIFQGSSSGLSTEGKQAKVKWSILKNRYSYSIEDDSAFIVDESTGAFSYGDFEAANPANILKVEVIHDDVTYYATLPINTAVVESGYTIKLKEETGFNFVEYTSDGKQPAYDSSFPFEIIITEDIDGYTEDISLKSNPEYAISYEWDILGSIKEGSPAKDIEQHSIIYMDYYSKGLNKNQRNFKTTDSYDGECVNNAIKCTAYQGGREVAKIHIPIHFMLNKYGNSAINGWDGNSVNINEEGGFILAPQAGAGQKEEDNSFTGILMGKVKEGLNKEENGLFGYYKGQRSIFLDAKTGIAKFGLNEIGQIVINPAEKKALLYSGNYSEDKKSGMLIDLTTPEIKYGNGNFSVDKDGKLIAKGNGSNIGGCIIENGILKVPAAYITGQLVADQIEAGAITVGGLDEALKNLINNATAKVEVQYALSDSATVPPTEGWSTVAPEWDPDKYMWQKTITTSSEGKVTESEPTCIMGAKGRGIKSTEITYQKGSSGTNTPTGTWLKTIPPVGPGEYLWSKIIYTYSDDTIDTFYTVSMMGQTGLQGLQGPQGETGIQGPKGDSGQTSYFHIKYSAVSNPTSTQMTEDPSEYIGTYVDFDPNDSTDPSKYTWARFRGLQGEDGTQGIPGKNGENGQTSYLHIKYSNDGGQSFTPNNGEDVGDYIGQYVDFTQTDSMVLNKYTWSKIKGEVGPQGVKGVGVKSVTPEYYLSTSNTSCVGGTWSETPPPYVNGRYYWTRSKVVYDNGTTLYTTEVLDNAVTDANRLAYAADSTIADWCYENDRIYMNGGKIYAGTVTAREIAAHTITADQIKASAITANEIAAHTITSSEIKAATITATEIAGHTITAAELATDAIKSQNYVYSSGNYSTTGTFLDLSNGVIRSKNFAIDSSGKAYFKGDIEANSFLLNGASLSMVDDSISSFIVNSDGTVINGSAKTAKGLKIGSGSIFIDNYAKIWTLRVTSEIMADQASIKELNASTFHAGTIYETGTLLSSKYAAYTHSHTGYAASSHSHFDYLDLYEVSSTQTVQGPISFTNTTTFSSNARFKKQIIAGTTLNNGIHFSDDSNADTGACIYVSSAQHMYFRAHGGTDADYALFYGVVNNTWTLAPLTNEKLNLGTSLHKWINVYAKNGTIQTSDIRQKNSIALISEPYEKVFNDLRPVTYKFNNGDRTHIGFISQEVENSMFKAGLTDMDWAAFCKDSDEKGDFIYGLRYVEIIALNTHMIQKLMKRIAQLEELIQQQQ